MYIDISQNGEEGIFVGLLRIPTVVGIILVFELLAVFLGIFVLPVDVVALMTLLLGLITLSGVFIGINGAFETVFTLLAFPLLAFIQVSLGPGPEWYGASPYVARLVSYAYLAFPLLTWSVFAFRVNEQHLSVAKESFGWCNLILGGIVAHWYLTQNHDSVLLIRYLLIPYGLAYLLCRVLIERRLRIGARKEIPVISRWVDCKW